MRKHLRIILALVGALAALPFFVQAERPETPKPTKAQPVLEALQSETPRALALPIRARMPEFGGDLVAPLENHAALPGARLAPAAVLHPAVNPYRFVGELREPGVTRSFLARGDELFEVKAGDVLDEGFRVAAVEEKEVVLLHVASGVRHTVLLSEPAAAAPTPAAPAAPAPGVRLILRGPVDGSIPSNAS